MTIILYIIIQHLMEEGDNSQSKLKIKDEQNSTLQISPTNLNEDTNAETPFAKPEPKVNNVSNRSGTVATIQVPKIISEGRKVNNPISKLNTDKETFADELESINQSQSVNQSQLVNPSQSVNQLQTEEVIYDRPNPWSKIIIDQRQEYPYLFHIKVKIPSLNDFENWKQIVPNIGFDARTGELIIPSKDEASAIALANLIVINFTGQLSLKDIIEKNLIQISVSKAKSYEVVQNKLRDQIMENLYGKQFNASQTSFEKDLAKKTEPFCNINNKARQNQQTQQNQQNQQNQQTNGKIDFTSDTFTDTFEHFSNNNIDEGIEAWDGNDFSYLN